MKYCMNCGESLKENQSFCVSCGHKQEEPVNQSTTSVSKNAAPKQPMSKKKKNAIIIAASIAVLLISAHFIISNLLDLMKTIQGMDRAMTDQNVDDFFNYVELEGEAFIHKEEYMEYVRDSDWENIRYQLTESFESKDDQSFDTTIRDYDGNPLFSVKRNAVVPGLYHTYDIKAIPVELLGTTNLKNTQITFNDEKIELENSEEITTLGWAYPGEYTVEGTASNEFGEFHYQETMTVYPNETQEAEVAISFPTETYAINTNQEEAILFINGESTDRSLGEYTEIGPFPEGEIVDLHAEWEDENGTIHKSEELDASSNIWGGPTFYFYPEEEEVYASEQTTGMEAEDEGDDNFDAIEDFMIGFLSDSVNALNHGDFSMVASSFTEDGEGKAEYEDFIDSSGDRIESETFLGGELLDYEEKEEGFIEVVMSENYEITYTDGEYKEPRLEGTYLLKEDEGDYKVDVYVNID
ncbi:TcaA NTF2-like domain-containing protein [Halobacillus sp. B23F22_1]|uniref:TcaA NTF2-like domain-containing protein n=1 Tax=Halobacillus sp. B23F22_1 TaxID=3459514 RepID=UPI00373F6EA0